MNKKCSFCGVQESEQTPLLAGENAYICTDCVISAYKIISGEAQEESSDNTVLLAPKEIKQNLDKHVIGQERAKKVISVAVYNHYKRIFKSSQNADEKISKSNVLLIGPTGSGKTFIAQTIANMLDLPIAITDATSLTEAGYVGEDVENILTRLYQAADGDVEKTQQGIIFIDEIDKISRLGENRSITRDVSGEGVQQALLKIIEGSSVNISAKGGRKHPNQDFITIDTSNILFICGGAFDGLEDIVKKRMGSNVLGFGQEQKSTKNMNAMSKVESDDLIHFGMIPELIGRLHVIATLNEISKNDMVRILTEPQNSIVSQYQKLFDLDGVSLEFEQDALEAIAQKAIDRKTGARGLRTIIEDKMIDIMFDLPEYEGYSVLITKEVIEGQTQPVYIKKSA
ncbi:MAG: ATP-dependent Clp protease ATP-binding subunit ClpX [Campylobacterota bacterium]